MRIATICGPGGDMFLKPIEAHWRARGDTVQRVDHWPLPGFDLLWIEWADEHAVQATRTVQRIPHVIRWHSYEAFQRTPLDIRWGNVDDVVFVAPHVERFAVKTFRIGDVERHVIPNGVDLSAFRMRKAPMVPFGGGRRIAWVGSVSHKKGPELWAQATIRLLTADPTATMHIAGAWLDPRYSPYFEHLMPADVQRRIEYHGDVPAEAMPDFFAGMDVVLSTSPWESFQYAVAEGICCGCLPLVHDWPGAREIYPCARIWTTLDELEESYRRSWRERDADRARALVEREYGQQAMLDRIDALVDGRVAKGMRHPMPTLSLVMLANGNEPRFRAAVESVRDHVDEVVVHLDTRKGDSNVRVAQELGLDFTAGEVPTFGGSIDFSATRNALHARATKDWLLLLDSDETVDDPAVLKPLIADALKLGQERGVQYDGIALDVQCYTDQGLAESSKDVRMVPNLPTIRYRFPVHNQLTGYSRVYGTDAKVRSTYVGGLMHRVDRAVPPLLELWRQGSEEPRDGELTVNGITIPKRDARMHAAFFLSRMYTAGGMNAEARPWFDRCREECPDLKYAAPFWTWNALSELNVSGVTAAEAIVDQGLRHWPQHPDLYHVRIGLDLIRWARAAVNEGAMPGVPMTSRPYIKGLGAAVKALGLPVRVGLEEREVEE